MSSSNEFSLPNSNQLKIFPFALVLFEITTYLSVDMYAPALPTLVQDLGITNALGQMTITMWFLGMASLFLLLGPISDRYGRRPVLLFGCLLFLGATLVCAITDNFSLFLVGRLLEGCSVCAIITAGYACVHECFDQRTAIQIVGMLGAISLLSPAFGPLIGAFFLEFAHWRMIFFALCALAFVSGVLLWRCMPETVNASQSPPIAWKPLLKGYGLILSERSFLTHVAMVSSLFMIIVLWIAGGPFLLMQRLSCSMLTFSLFQILVFGAVILGVQLLNVLIEKISLQAVIQTGVYTLFFSALLSVLTTKFYPESALALVIPLTLFNVGLGLIFSPAQRLALEGTSQPMGQRVAVFSSVANIFSMLGSVIASLFMEMTLFDIAIMMLIAALISMIAFYVNYVHIHRSQDKLSS